MEQATTLAFILLFEKRKEIKIMTKEELNNKLYEAAMIGDYINFRDDVFQVIEEDKLNIKRTFSHIDYLYEYLETKHKLVKNIKCIDGIDTTNRHTTYNLFRIIAIDANYTLDELLELGYSFKEINKILKQQKED